MASLAQINYALKVLETGQFGKAAEACFVTQPTLSQQIQKLEDEIGFLLFDRNKKPIAPTKQGKIYLDQAFVVLRESRKLETLNYRKGGKLSGLCSLGVIPTISPFVVPLFVDEFCKNNRQVQLTIDEFKTEEIISELKSGKLDCGLLATPLNERELTEVPLYYEPFKLYMRSDRGSADNKEVNLRSLSKENVWLLQDGHCLRQQVINFCASAEAGGLHPNLKFQSGNLESLRFLIQNNGGFTFLPQMFVDSLPRAEQKKFIHHIAGRVPTREVSLVFQKDDFRLEMIEALKRSILDNLPPSVVKVSDKKGLEQLQVLPVERMQ